LLKLCADVDARVRASSLAAVATLPVEPAQLRSRIETALKDESALVRMTAVQLIPSLGDERRRFAPALIAAL
jgi:hypothetical protein